MYRTDQPALIFRAPIIFNRCPYHLVAVDSCLLLKCRIVYQTTTIALLLDASFAVDYTDQAA